jgi:hypothetical protein
METKYKDFTDYLKDKHAEDYHGTDDDMPDAFDNWLTELQADDFIQYADEYADLKEMRATKNMRPI